MKTISVALLLKTPLQLKMANTLHEQHVNKGEPLQQFISLAITISRAVTHERLCILYYLKIKTKARSLAAILLLTDHSLYECQ